MLADETQRIATWNQVAADLFRVPAAQALGQLAADVAGRPRTAAGLSREDFAQIIAEQGFWSGSLLYQRRDGSEFLLQDSKADPTYLNDWYDKEDGQNRWS